MVFFLDDPLLFLPDRSVLTYLHRSEEGLYFVFGRFFFSSPPTRNHKYCVAGLVTVSLEDLVRRLGVNNFFLLFYGKFTVLYTLYGAKLLVPQNLPTVQGAQ
jgi:hypothetical protein